MSADEPGASGEGLYGGGVERLPADGPVVFLELADADPGDLANGLPSMLSMVSVTFWMISFFCCRVRTFSMMSMVTSGMVLVLSVLGFGRSWDPSWTDWEPGGCAGRGVK